MLAVPAFLPVIAPRLHRELRKIIALVTNRDRCVSVLVEPRCVLQNPKGVAMPSRLYQKWIGVVGAVLMVAGIVSVSGRGS